MCGYCSEQIVFEMLDAERLNKDFSFPLSDTFYGHLYLQATSKPLHALEKVVDSVIRQKVVSTEIVPPDTLLCRGLEIFLNNGFDSPVYQRFLNNRHYRHALTISCSPKKRSELKSVSKRFGIEHLAILYEIDTYLTKDGVFQLRTLVPLKKECHELLVYYIQWWLDGNGLIGEDSGGYAPADIETFAILFRAVWFSLFSLGRYQPAKPILLKMISTPPERVPFFDGMDLWIQRQSALMLYDLEGLTPFLQNLDKVRGSLIYFLDLKRNLTPAQKVQLLEVTKNLPRGDADDVLCFSLKDWLEQELVME